MRYLERGRYFSDLSLIRIWVFLIKMDINDKMDVKKTMDVNKKMDITTNGR